MKVRIICVEIMLLVAFSLCISEETTEPTEPSETEMTQTPEATGTPTTTSVTTTVPPTTPTTTSISVSPGKKELVINQEKTQNNISIKVSKLYYINEPKYGSSGPLEDHLRIELSIRNDDDNNIEFYPNITSIIEDDLKNQYVVLSMPSSKNWGEIKPQESKEGYISFPRMDGNAESITIVLRNDTTAVEFVVDIQDF